jgi:hypothetical protein
MMYAATAAVMTRVAKESSPDIGLRHGQHWNAGRNHSEIASI